MKMKFSPKRKKKPPLGSGKRFEELSSKIAASYKKKGMSSKRAEKIGAATAAIQGRKKYGQARMTKLASVGRKRK